jgi:ABC-2 type transport system permease protein
MPIVQLVVLGCAFGGTVRHLKLGIVQQDRGVPAVKLLELTNAVRAGARTFETSAYPDVGTAVKALRDGRLNGVLTIPPDFSRRVLAKENPQVALIEDNTDGFVAAALSSTMASLVQAYDLPPENGQRMLSTTSLDMVEVYPYVPYIQYLLPGSIVMSIFMMVMIGGGIIFIDDKARGLHEGYLVTPITKFELILGFNLAGVAKAVLSGLVLITLGSLIAGIPDPFNFLRLLRMLFLVICTALALISMMFLLVVRMTDPLLPRALFGVLNTLLFFPSGAVYPIKAFPGWMRAITAVDPFTYAVDGFKCLLLKNTGLLAISGDIFFLLAFATISLGAATLLFKRTL